MVGRKIEIVGKSFTNLEKTIAQARQKPIPADYS